jgi:hypothetical protein
VRLVQEEREVGKKSRCLVVSHCLGEMKHAFGKAAHAIRFPFSSEVAAFGAVDKVIRKSPVRGEV